jgi:hypothetical protein
MIRYDLGTEEEFGWEESVVVACMDPADDGDWVKYEEAVEWRDAAVAAARAEGEQTAVAGWFDSYAKGQRDALAAIPDNDHRSDLDPLDYDGDVAYGLAVAREAVERLIKGDSE